MSFEERSDSLANCESLSEAHEVCAGSGQTEATPDVEHHFISYVNLDGTLYEFGECFNVLRKFEIMLCFKIRA